MSPLDGWRKELHALLPGGFLRRAQGDALLVSDAPRHITDVKSALSALENAGFPAEAKNGLLYIDGSPAKYRALAADAPFRDIPACAEGNAYLYALALRLLRHPAPPEEQPPALLRLTLKMLDAGDEQGLARELPPLLAACQRQKKTLPTAAGYWIIRYLAEKEGTSC